MANYYGFCIADVVDPSTVGVGTGDAPDGSLRICVSLEGQEINAALDGTWLYVNWRALTPRVARALYEQLESLKHLWADEPPEQISPAIDDVLP